MAKTEIKVNCGCGKIFPNLEAAQIHADEKKHILTVLGTVKPELRKE